MSELLDNNQYRRKEDEGNRMLWELNERVANVQKLLEDKTNSYERVLEKIIEKQNILPCRTNSWRIKTIEKILCIIGAGVVALFVRIFYIWVQGGSS